MLWGVYILDPTAKLAGIEPQQILIVTWAHGFQIWDVPQNSHLNLEV